MKTSEQVKFIVIHEQASSLYSLIAGGKYRATSLGRDMWKSLFGSEGSQQQHCNREGFNAMCTSQAKPPKARIGIVANNIDTCTACESRIGFGIGGHPDDSNKCGMEVVGFYADDGGKSIKAIGYILVQ